MMTSFLRQLKQIKKELYESVSRFDNLQPWTKLVEIKVKNTVNSSNDTDFEIPDSPPFPQYQY